MDNKVLITKEEYAELIRCAEKIAAVERYVDRQYYFDAKDIISILGIKEEHKDVQ